MKIKQLLDWRLTKLKEIEAGKERLTTLLVNTEYRYKIPDFQRSYVWGVEQARELMNDFSLDTNDFTRDPLELDGYLLGNTVVIEDDITKTRYVIDGQQRITTITLLFRILYLKHKNLLSNNLLTDDYSLSMSSRLLHGYNQNKNFNGTEFINRLYHDESLNFGQTYRELLNGTSDNADIDETSSDKNIRIVYETLSEYVDTMSIEQHLKFSYYLEHKVSMIVTKAPNISKAFQLFEILNNRGVGLEPIDLIKNYFLKKLDELDSPEEKVMEFKNNWTTFLDNLHFNNRYSIPESQFLKHYIIGTKGRNIKNEDMYTKFVDEIFKSPTLDEIIDFSKDIKRKSLTYTKISYKADNDYTENINKLKYLNDTLGIKQLFFLLIPFYNESEEIKEEVLDLAIKLGSSILFSFTQTNFIEREIPILIEKYITDSTRDKPNAYAEFKVSIKNIIKNFAGIAHESIRTRKFDKGNTLKPINKAQQILRFIEFYSMNNMNALDKKINNKIITVEHILAVKLDSTEYANYGFESEEDYKDNLNRIGNLTLLLFDSNISASNKTPAEKEVYYKESEFFITQKLVNDINFSVKSGDRRTLVDTFNTQFTSFFTEQETFNKCSIEKRSKEVADFVHKLLTN